MADEPPFLADARGTREEIMRATYRALCEHGYADLTIQRIGDQFGKSKSLLYHHYDSKDELLLEFLEFMLDAFEESVPDAGDEAGDARLDAVFDRIFGGGNPEFEGAMVELRAQAAHDERYREYFARHDRVLGDRLARVVEVGVADGAFRDVDPDRVASFLLALFEGVQTRRATSDASDLSTVREELDAYVNARLLADGADE